MWQVQRLRLPRSPASCAQSLCSRSSATCTACRSSCCLHTATHASSSRTCSGAHSVQVKPCPHQAPRFLSHLACLHLCRCPTGATQKPRAVGASPFPGHGTCRCAGLPAEAPPSLAPRRTPTRGSAPATPACPGGWGRGRCRPPPPGLRRAPPPGPPPAALPPSTAPWPASGVAGIADGAGVSGVQGCGIRWVIKMPHLADAIHQ